MAGRFAHVTKDVQESRYGIFVEDSVDGDMIAVFERIVGGMTDNGLFHGDGNRIPRKGFR